MASSSRSTTPRAGTCQDQSLPAIRLLFPDSCRASPSAEDRRNERHVTPDFLSHTAGCPGHYCVSPTRRGDHRGIVSQHFRPPLRGGGGEAHQFGRNGGFGLNRTDEDQLIALISLINARNRISVINRQPAGACQRGQSGWNQITRKAALSPPFRISQRGRACS